MEGGKGRIKTERAAAEERPLSHTAGTIRKLQTEGNGMRLNAIWATEIFSDNHPFAIAAGEYDVVYRARLSICR